MQDGLFEHSAERSRKPADRTDRKQRHSHGDHPPAADEDHPDHDQDDEDVPPSVRHELGGFNPVPFPSTPLADCHAFPRQDDH